MLVSISAPTNFEYGKWVGEQMGRSKRLIFSSLAKESRAVIRVVIPGRGFNCPIDTTPFNSSFTSSNECKISYDERFTILMHLNVLKRARPSSSPTELIQEKVLWVPYNNKCKTSSSPPHASDPESSPLRC
jgi:hypothetical protein